MCKSEIKIPIYTMEQRNINWKLNMGIKLSDIDISALKSELNSMKLDDVESKSNYLLSKYPKLNSEIISTLIN